MRSDPVIRTFQSVGDDSGVITTLNLRSWSLGDIEDLVRDLNKDGRFKVLTAKARETKRWEYLEDPTEKVWADYADE